MLGKPIGSKMIGLKFGRLGISCLGYCHPVHADKIVPIRYMVGLSDAAHNKAAGGLPITLQPICEVHICDRT